MAVGVECHGGLGGIGIKNTIVIFVVRLMVSSRLRRLSTKEYVEKNRRCALVKRLLKLGNAGVM